MQVRLHDGKVMSAQDIEAGYAYQCPNCRKFVQQRNIKRDSANGRLICILCAVAINQRLYSKKSWLLKTLKDFIGASYD